MICPDKISGRAPFFLARHGLPRRIYLRLGQDTAFGLTYLPQITTPPDPRCHRPCPDGDVGYRVTRLAKDIEWICYEAIAHGHCQLKNQRADRDLIPIKKDRRRRYSRLRVRAGFDPVCPQGRVHHRMQPHDESVSTGCLVPCVADHIRSALRTNAEFVGRERIVIPRKNLPPPFARGTSSEPRRRSPYERGYDTSRVYCKSSVVRL